MDDRSRTDLDALLEQLELEERSLSASRRRLHDQADLFGGTDGADSASAELSARERALSDRRRELHRRIDSLKDDR
jgi:hypothetical protein